MPDIQPFEVGLMAGELGLFRYKGQTSSEAVFFTEGYLHFLDLQTFDVRSDSIGDNRLFNFHIDFTKPLAFPEDGLLLFNNNLDIEHFDYSERK